MRSFIYAFSGLVVLLAGSPAFAATEQAASIFTATASHFADVKKRPKNTAIAGAKEDAMAACKQKYNTCSIFSVATRNIRTESDADEIQMIGGKRLIGNVSQEVEATVLVVGY